MTIDEMQQRRLDIDDLIEAGNLDPEKIESLKHEYNTLGSEIERLQQDNLDQIIKR